MGIEGGAPEGGKPQRRASVRDRMGAMEALGGDGGGERAAGAGERPGVKEDKARAVTAAPVAAKSKRVGRSPSPRTVPAAPLRRRLRGLLLTRPPLRC